MPRPGQRAAPNLSRAEVAHVLSLTNRGIGVDGAPTAAYRSAAAAAAGAKPNAEQTAETYQAAAEAADKRHVTNEVLALMQATADRAPVSEADTLEGNLVYTFAYDGSNAPVVFKPTLEALQTAFGNRVDFSKPVYVHSIDVTGYHNSAPYPIGFHMSGAQGETIKHEIKGSGEAVTMLLMPDTRSERVERVYTADDLNLDDLREHGGTTLDSQYKACTPIMDIDDNLVAMMVDTTSNIGQILNQNKERFVDKPGGELLTVHAGNVHRYVVAAASALDMLAAYDASKLSRLKPTDMLRQHQASLSRFDHPAADVRAFHDMEGVAALSPAARQHAEKSNQLVIVRARVRIVNPARMQ